MEGHVHREDRKGPDALPGHECHKGSQAAPMSEVSDKIESLTCVMKTVIPGYQSISLALANARASPS